MTKEFISTAQPMTAVVLLDEELRDYTMQGHPSASFNGREDDIYMLLGDFMEKNFDMEDAYDDDGGEHSNLRRVEGTDQVQIDYTLYNSRFANGETKDVEFKITGHFFIDKGEEGFTEDSHVLFISKLECNYED